MVFQWCFIAFCFLLLAAAYGCVQLARVIHYWRCEGRKMETDKNYRTPPPGFLHRLFRYLAGWLASMWCLGRIRKIGRLPQKLKKGRYIYVCNHQTEADGVLLAWMLGLRKVRYFVAFNQCRGERGPFVAYTGGILVDFFDEVGSNSPPLNIEQPDRPFVRRRLLEAVQSAVSILTKEPDTDFFIFPQGRLVRDNDLRLTDFQHGAIRIAQSLEEPVFLVPIGVHYDHNPNNRTVFAKLFNFLGFKSYGRVLDTVNAQTAVAIGEPLPLSELPLEKNFATAVLFDQIKALTEKAAASCGNRRCG